MRLKKTEFIIDNAGNKKSVILDYNDYLKMIQVIEDIEDSKKIRKTKSEAEISLSAYKRKKSLV
ncbi:MAG TPA: hypothetical protein PK514_00715 [Spirochaetota bacterium]|nr:hypothetical protein [Spirochaetota bacterium]